MTRLIALAFLCVIGARTTAIADPMADADPLAVVGHRNPLDTDPCIDSDDVLGYRQCSQFGDWANVRLAPQLVLEAGMTLRHVPAGSLAAIHRDFAAVATSPSAPPGWMEAAAFRALVGVGRAGYVGIETDVGEQETGGMQDAVVDYLGIVGVAYTIGPFDVGGELALGGTALSSASFVDSELIIEPRARIELWLSPWFTVGGEVGTNLLIQGAWMTGAYIGFHSYSYGGLR
jgi:hypothetical protein